MASDSSAIRFASATYQSNADADANDDADDFAGADADADADNGDGADADANADHGDAVQIPVAVLMRVDNHHPCRERLQAKTLKTSLLSPTPSSCSENNIVNIAIITIVNIVITYSTTVLHPSVDVLSLACFKVQIVQPKKIRE